MCESTNTMIPIHHTWHVSGVVFMCYAHSRRLELRTPARNLIKHFLTSAARPAANLSWLYMHMYICAYHQTNMYNKLLHTNAAVACLKQCLWRLTVNSCMFFLRLGSFPFSCRLPRGALLALNVLSVCQPTTPTWVYASVHIYPRACVCALLF